MRHPYEKYIRLELITLIIAVFAGIIVLIKGFLFLAIFLIYLVACALCCEAMIELNTHNRNNAFKHFLQAILILVFMSFIVFHL